MKPAPPVLFLDPAPPSNFDNLNPNTFPPKVVVTESPWIQKPPSDSDLTQRLMTYGLKGQQYYPATLDNIYPYPCYGIF